MAVSGTFTLNGTATSGAKVTVIDIGASPPEVVGTAVTAADGTYSVDVGRTTTVHATIEYEAGDGTLHQDYSKPFVHHESPVPAPVGTPVHWWPMDEGAGATIADNQGTENGTITGATWIDDTTHRWIGGWALSGDGVDDYVDTGAPTTPITGEIAVCFTFTHPYADGTVPAQQAMIARAWDGSTVAYNARFLTSNELQIEVYDGGQYAIHVPLANIPADTPQRCVIQYDATAAEVQVYLNDALAGSVAKATGIPSNTSVRTFLAANEQGTLMNHFGGVIDDVVIYNRALTAQERTDDYNRQPWTP